MLFRSRKPLSEKTVAENVLKWGTGGINIDESRVDYTSEYDKKHQDDIQKGQLNADNGKFFGGSGQSISSGNLQGRFPANLIHDNSEEVRECFPDVKTGSIKPHQQNSVQDSFGMKDKFITGSHSGDSGNASRFFKSIIYQAKASKSERNRGCEGLEEKTSPNNLCSGSVQKSGEGTRLDGKPLAKKQPSNSKTYRPYGIPNQNGNSKRWISFRPICRFRFNTCCC